MCWGLSVINVISNGLERRESKRRMEKKLEDMDKNIIGNRFTNTFLVLVISGAMSNVWCDAGENSGEPWL